MERHISWIGASLDLSTVAEFERTVRSGGAASQNLVVAMDALEFVDSTGVRTLVALKQDWEASGGSLRYTGFRQDILEILDIMGITDMVVDPGEETP